MTTTAFSPPPVSHPKRSTGWIIVGAVIIVSGFLTAISGGALLALFGSDRVLSSGEHRVSTPTTALVADLGRITDVDGFQYVMGSPTLHVTADNDGEGPIFIGIGRADEVDRYLAGVSTDRVTDLEVSPFELNSVRHDGSGTPGAPAQQNIWVASSTSSHAELSWEIRDGHYEVVMMNADGSTNVKAQTRIGVSLQDSTALWSLVIGAGVVIMVIGGVVVIAAARRGSNGR
jgi:hypothetical protein